MHNELATQSHSGLSLFDNGMFEQMGRIAAQLAQSSLIPETLKTEGPKGNKKNLPLEVVTANCFRIVEQAKRWGMSPFAVIDHASVVHGKLQWEGKLVHATIEAMLGIRLDYKYSGKGLDRTVTVIGKFPDESEARTVEGNVKIWKTDQWQVNAYDQRLAYRGAREWARRHAPSALLGVVTTDEEIPQQQGMRHVNGSIRRETPLTLSSAQEGGLEETPSAVQDSKLSKEVAPSDSEASDEVESSSPHSQGLRQVFIMNVSKSHSEPESERQWTRYAVKVSLGQAIQVASTFSSTIGDAALANKGKFVMAEFEENDKGVTLAALEEMEQPATPDVEGGIC